MRVTRLAPSPTGALHLGNARTFLANWLMARQAGMKIVLRIEDLDGPRIKQGADQQAIEDLRWLGIDWDEGPTYQSRQIDRYARALETLIAKRLVYPCVCSRKEIEQAASAPHAEDGAAVYPGTCRGRFASAEEAFAASGRAPAWRFAVPAHRFAFEDAFAGACEYDLAKDIGDFVVAKPDGLPAYQLSVVVDDIDAGVTDIVRGDDLLDSVPRQALIYEALGQSQKIPRYTHLPLVIGEDGKRLAKRHGDTRVSMYRELGVPADRLRALLASWLGLDAGESITTAELLSSFSKNNIPKGPIIFSAEHDRFLRAAAVPSTNQKRSAKHVG